MERLAPPRKHDPVACQLPSLGKAADTVTAVATIVDAVAAGDLAPSEAFHLAKVVELYMDALATSSFEERLTIVESTANK